MNPEPALPQTTLNDSYTDLYWTTHDGLQIVARQWTVEPSRGSVLILHGIGDHSGRSSHVAEYLNTAGFSVLAPDLRGHGRSDGQRGYIKDFDTLLTDIDLFLEKSRTNCENGPAFIYGQSMGGLMAIYYSIKRRPDLCGLIASSPALRIAMPAPQWKVAIGKFLKTVWPRMSLDSGLDPEQLSDDVQVAARVRSDRFRHRRVTPGAYFGMVDAGQWCLDHATEMACPVLLMHGDADQITDCAASVQFADTANNVSIRIWKDGKHELHNMTNRMEVLDAVIDFQNTCIRAGSRNTD